MLNSYHHLQAYLSLNRLTLLQTSVGPLLSCKMKLPKDFALLHHQFHKIAKRYGYLHDNKIQLEV